jgi:hypothetical protein
VSTVEPRKWAVRPTSRRYLSASSTSGLWRRTIRSRIHLYGGSGGGLGTFLINLLLGACRYRNQSRPFTLGNQTYKVCLDRGKEIGYSLETMASCRVAHCSEALIDLYRDRALPSHQYRNRDVS